MNETELLFTEILDCGRMSLYLNKESILSKDKLRLVSSALKRRIKGEPIQYILGKCEFMGLEFKLTPEVLIPRPETEILVEAVMKIYQETGKSTRILDLGTGSGCVAISLAKLLPAAKITATEICAAALSIALENAKLNNAEINFIRSDLFKSSRLKKNNYDIIISNPPYIASSEIKKLQPEVQFEPVIALDGGNGGLDFYKKIINGAAKYLRKEGFLIFEIGFDQKDAVKEIFQNSGYFEIIEVIKDYNNLDRAIVSKKVK